jgi:outer membrane protein
MPKLPHPIAIGLLCVCLLTLSPDSVRAEVARLADLERSAVRAAPSLSASKARLVQSVARLKRAESAYYPSLALDASASLAPGGKLIRFGDYWVSGSQDLTGDSEAFLPHPRYGLVMGLRGTLYDFGRTSAAVEAASASRAGQLSESQANEDAVRRTVRAAYLRWATAHAVWLLADERVRAAIARERQTADLVTEGVRAKVDLTASSAQTVQAEIDLERATADLESARLDLGYVAHQQVSPSAEPEPELLAGPGQKRPGGSGSDPATEALEAQQEAAQASARIYERVHAPVIAANANLGVEGRNTKGGARVFPVYMAGLSVSIPLWDGGSAKSQAEEARAKADEATAFASARREEINHGLARTRAAEAHATRWIERAERWVKLGQTRVAELESGGDLSSAALAALYAAQLELHRARLELVLARSARAEAALGLLR